MSREGLCFPLAVKVRGPEENDRTADAGRLREALEDFGIFDAGVPLAVLRVLPERLRQENGLKTVVIGYHQGRPMVLGFSERPYGLAFDVGSTNIVCSLFDLREGRRLDTVDARNPQMRFGPDVLSRAQFAIAGKGEELTAEVLSGMNGLITVLCERQGISAGEIYGVVVSGNTIMTHSFLGLDLRNIPVSPFVPAVNESVFCAASETGLCVNGNALVYVFPNAGSYVGGDILSGIVACGILREPEPVLFVDVGTNVELTLGSREWIMVGAGAAGPALESGIAEIGRSSGTGTISAVKVDRATGRAEVEVEGGVEPSGICATALIDLVSGLYDAGVIDRAGRLVDGRGGVMVTEGEKVYEIYRSGEEKLLLREREIQNFLRSKAGMFAFLLVFLRSVGLSFRDIRKVYVAGALGSGMNIESAVNIGMLPDMPRERFVSVGNSSLRGAEMLLLNRAHLEEIEEVRRRITYRAMSEEQELLTTLQAAMFIPHTDPEVLRG